MNLSFINSILLCWMWILMAVTLLFLELRLIWNIYSTNTLIYNVSNKNVFTIYYFFFCEHEGFALFTSSRILHGWTFPSFFIRHIYIASQLVCFWVNVGDLLVFNPSSVPSSSNVCLPLITWLNKCRMEDVDSIAPLGC